MCLRLILRGYLSSISTAASVLWFRLLRRHLSLKVSELEPFFLSLGHVQLFCDPLLISLLEPVSIYNVFYPCLLCCEHFDSLCSLFSVLSIRVTCWSQSLLLLQKSSFCGWHDTLWTLLHLFESLFPPTLSTKLACGCFWNLLDELCWNSSTL